MHGVLFPNIVCASCTVHRVLPGQGPGRTGSRVAGRRYAIPRDPANPICYAPAGPANPVVCNRLDGPALTRWPGLCAGFGYAFINFCISRGESHPKRERGAATQNRETRVDGRRGLGYARRPAGGVLRISRAAAGPRATGRQSLKDAPAGPGPASRPETETHRVRIRPRAFAGPASRRLPPRADAQRPGQSRAPASGQTSAAGYVLSGWPPAGRHRAPVARPKPGAGRRPAGRGLSDVRSRAGGPPAGRSSVHGRSRGVCPQAAERPSVGRLTRTPSRLGLLRDSDSFATRTPRLGGPSGPQAAERRSADSG